MTQDTIAAALKQGRLVDITTTGRRSGMPHRIEIPYFNVEERLFIIGDPRTHDAGRVLRPRDWYEAVGRRRSVLLSEVAITSRRVR